MTRTHLRTLLTALVSTWMVFGFMGSLLAADTSWATTDASPTTHHIRTVFIILMENHNWTGDGNLDIKGNPAAPYINKTLIPMGSHAEQYFNPPNNHPSLPNYLWLEAGTNFGIYDDGPPSQHPLSSKLHLVTLLKKANISWKAYLENITGKVCPLTDSGEYAVRHEPFAYFDDVSDHQNPKSKYCIAHLRPYGELASDLKNGTVARYNWITPNLCDDMHDSCNGRNPIAQGDTWLAHNVPAILKSAVFKKGGAMFIVWDEADRGDGPIPMIVLSPFAKGHGYSNQIHYTHGSMLRTMEEIFGVKPLLRDAAKEKDLSKMFTVFP
jgi:phosphatidylinositol-3-phosphatase